MYLFFGAEELYSNFKGDLLFFRIEVDMEIDVFVVLGVVELGVDLG